MKITLAPALLLAAALAALAADPAPPQPDLRAFASTPTLVDEYVIGSHDLLAISVFDLKEFDREVRVGDDGSISLPLLGQVAVGGLTPRQAEETIGGLLQEKELLKNPQVSVLVKEFVSRRVFVQGAVSKPGPVELLGQKSLLDVLGEAGGLNDRAMMKIIVSRPFAKPGEERIEVDAERLVYQGDPLANLMVQPGDIIVVPYEQPFKVFVTGAVARPGAVEFKSDELMTVLQAVTSAGGPTDRANESRVQIIRRTDGKNGAQQLFKVNLKRIKRGKIPDIPLQRNDIVVVSESFF